VSRVLVADPDPTLVGAVSRGLAYLGLRSVGCTSREALRESLERGPFDAIVIDCDLAASDLERGIAPSVPVVLTRSYLSRSPAREIAARAVVLHKPFTSIELANALRDELGLAIGRPASLIDALRVAHELRRSVRIDVNVGGTPACVHIAEGEIVDAACGSLAGEHALLQILTGPSSLGGERKRRHRHRSIDRPFHELMLDLLVAIDASEISPSESGLFRLDRLG
jgi:CheY-like chemotaxis protein